MSIYDKKYQIFVSSTYIDLIKAREEVIKVILGLYQIPIGMEMFSADNDEQWSIIRSTIDSSDYYLLIIGHRYGSLTKEEISYTEKEFDYAKQNEIPIIAFVRDRNYATKPDERDSDLTKVQKLESFVAKVLDNSMCDFWQHENELGQKVAIALTKLFFKTPRIGWVRSDKSASLQTTEQLAALVEENRELRDELQRLRSYQNKEVPDIEIKINSKAELSYEYNPKDLVTFDLINIDEIPKDLIKDISKEEIDTYNNAVTQKRKELNNYIHHLNEFESKKESHIEVKVEVLNKGKTKANDIYVDLTFPKEIKVFEKTDLNKLDKPVQPDIPKNPVKAAQERKFQKIMPALTTQAINVHNVDFISNVFLPKLIHHSVADKKFWIDHDSNQLTIKLDKLLHTRSMVIDDDILIAPLSKGNFSINISIVCDEYAERKEIEIPIEIK